MRRSGMIPTLLAILLVASLGYIAGSAHLLSPSHTIAADDCQMFPQTGFQICGGFLAYWNAHGGLAQQGYPISASFQEKSDTDGKTYTVQYFERAVFEAHPENQPPNDILLSLVGSQKYKAKYPNGAPSASAASPTASVGPAAPPLPLPMPTPIPASTPAPSTAAAPSTGLTVTFGTITSPVVAGSNAAVTIMTEPGATCSIVVTYQSGQATVKGLEPKIADSVGRAYWSWLVAGNTTLGAWPIDVTCSLNGQMAVAHRTLMVT